MVCATLVSQVCITDSSRYSTKLFVRIPGLIILNVSFNGIAPPGPVSETIDYSNTIQYNNDKQRNSRKFGNTRHVIDEEARIMVEDESS